MTALVALGAVGVLIAGMALRNPAVAQPPADPEPPAIAQPNIPEMNPLPDPVAIDALLAAFVRMPGVDYAALKASRGALDAVLATFAATSEATLQAAPRPVQLAFWINAYNLCMLKRVVDHYPISRGGAGLFGAIRNRAAGYPDNSVWQIRDVFTGPHCEIVGALRSQDEIEHEIIRPRFDDPRIHFAVNCAALSCPVLWPEGYRAERLDEQLDLAVTTFMGNRMHFRLDSATANTPATLTLNKVLDWYRDDFGGVNGLRTFFAAYVEGPPRAALQNSTTQVRFFDYDWTLNDARE